MVLIIDTPNTLKCTNCSQCILVVNGFLCFGRDRRKGGKVYNRCMSGVLIALYQGKVIELKPEKGTDWVLRMVVDTLLLLCLLLE